MTNQKKTIEVALDESLVTSLDELSRREGESRSELINKACRRFVEERASSAMDEKVRAYVEGYRRIPESGVIGDLSTSLAAEALSHERT